MAGTGDTHNGYFTLAGNQLISAHNFSGDLSQTISITEPALSRDPYAGVVAANRAAQRALDQLVALLHDPAVAFDARRNSK